jgi:hypothetical protein
MNLDSACMATPEAAAFIWPVAPRSGLGPRRSFQAAQMPAAGALSRFRPEPLNGRIAPTAAVRTSGTVSPKQSSAGAAANGLVGWKPVVSKDDLRGARQSRPVPDHSE